MSIAGSGKAFKEFNKESYEMQKRLVKQIREGKISSEDAQAKANVEMARLVKKYNIDPIGPISDPRKAKIVSTTTSKKLPEMSKKKLSKEDSARIKKVSEDIRTGVEAALKTKASSVLLDYKAGRITSEQAKQRMRDIEVGIVDKVARKHNVKAHGIIVRRAKDGSIEVGKEVVGPKQVLVQTTAAVPIPPPLPPPIIPKTTKTAIRAKKKESGGISTVGLGEAFDSKAETAAARLMLEKGGKATEDLPSIKHKAYYGPSGKFEFEKFKKAGRARGYSDVVLEGHIRRNVDVIEEQTRKRRAKRLGPAELKAKRESEARVRGLQAREEVTPVGRMFERIDDKEARKRRAEEMDIKAKERFAKRKVSPVGVVTKEKMKKAYEDPKFMEKIRDIKTVAISDAGHLSKDVLAKRHRQRLASRYEVKAAADSELKKRIAEAGFFQDAFKAQRRVTSIMKIYKKKEPKGGFTPKQVELGVNRRGRIARTARVKVLYDPLTRRDVKDASRLRINHDKRRDIYYFEMVAPLARYPDGRDSILSEVWSFLNLMKAKPIGQGLVDDVRTPVIERGYIKYHVKVRAKKEEI